MNTKKYVRQKISYLLCSLAGIWIIFAVLLHADSINSYSKYSLIFVGTVLTVFNSYFYIRSRKKEKRKGGSKGKTDYKRVELDNLNESYKQGLITTEEYKKLSQEILSDN